MQSAVQVVRFVIEVPVGADTSRVELWEIGKSVVRMASEQAPMGQSASLVDVQMAECYWRSVPREQD